MENCGTGDGGFQPGNTCQGGSGLSGIDVSSWPGHNSAAKWGMKKIAGFEKLAAEGKWAELEAAKYVPKSAKMNKYQKGVVAAQEKLLAMASGDAPAGPSSQIKGAGSYKSTEGWKKTDGKLGTEMGGVYTDPSGQKHYVKAPKNVDRAKNEVLASKLYQEAGASVVDSNLVSHKGKPASAAAWVDGSGKANWNSKAVRDEAAKDFAVHAWLGNWDAVGAGSENPMNNIVQGKNGLVLVDTGGSLDYKGMGGAGKKPGGLSAAADEWDTMRNASVNPSAAKVYGKMTHEQLIASSEKLKGVTDAKIDELVDLHGPGTKAEKKDLATKLKKRRDHIVSRGEKLKKGLGLDKTDGTPKPAAAKKPAPVKPAPAGTAKQAPTIPPAPIVTSKANAGYQKKFDAIHAAAATGDVAAVQAIKTKEGAKQTYAKKAHAYKMQVLEAMQGGATVDPATPKPKPAASPKPTKSTKPKASAKLPPAEIPTQPEFYSSNAANVKANTMKVGEIVAFGLDGDVDSLKKFDAGPSPKVQQYKKDMLAAMDAKANPPPPPKPLSGKLTDLKSKFSAKPSPGAQKVGYWAVHGDAGVPPKSEIPKGKWMSDLAQDKLHAKGHASIKAALKKPGSKKLSGQEWEAMSDYTASGYHEINESLRKGKPTSQAKRAVSGVLKTQVTLPKGTTLSRKYSQSPPPLKVGSVISEPGILSTATSNHVWSGNTHMTLVAGQGVKGVPIDDFSMNKGEKEVLLPPNTRLYIAEVKQAGSQTHVKAMILPFDSKQWP